MNGITKLEISRYDQISSGRPLENAYHAATGECSEIENNLFVSENGDLYTASEKLIEWYRGSYYNSLADDITIIIDHDNKIAFMPDNPDDFHDAHERKWHRFKVTLYHQKQQKEFTAFGEEYTIDEIKSEADDLIEKYVGEHQTAAWETSGQTHTRQINDYSVVITVIP